MRVLGITSCVEYVRAQLALNMIPSPFLDTFCFWDLRQDVLLKDEFHYLNVPSVGTYTVYDVFDCTFECLSNPFCLSLNMAASKGADGKMWSELLSSTKYSKSEEFKGNGSSHHLSVKVG